METEQDYRTMPTIDCSRHGEQILVSTFGGGLFCSACQQEWEDKQQREEVDDQETKKSKLLFIIFLLFLVLAMVAVAVTQFHYGVNIIGVLR